MRPILLAQEPQAEQPFSCTSDPQGEEVARGPSAKTNLKQVRVVRSSQGICAVFTFPKDTTGSGAPPSGSLRLTFYRDGDTSAPAENITAGKPQRSVEITLYNDPTYQPPGDYMLSTSIPENGNSVGHVTLGRLGVGARVVSVLVAKPKMPAWVFDKDTVWRGQIV